jgi:hypothetical protein
MIVQRVTYAIKPGSQSKMAEILKDLWKVQDDPPTHRIYLTITGDREVIQQEVEFEDFDAQEKFWAGAESRPGVAPLLEKWAELRDTGSTNQFLRLVE